MPTPTETVREIALNQPSSIRVFEQFGIDYCCGGRKPLADACAEQNIETASLLAALESATKATDIEAKNWADSPLENLIEHIVSKHHEYVKRELPRLGSLANKVVQAHGANHSEVTEIEKTLSNLGEELTQHLGKEEMILFPYIANLERALAGKSPKPHGCFGTVANPIAMMTAEHDAAGEALAHIRKLSGNFTLPEDACPTYHAFYDGLKEFEHDLHQHIHLENNILFPRAIQMEASETH